PGVVNDEVRLRQLAGRLALLIEDAELHRHLGELTGVHRAEQFEAVVVAAGWVGVKRGWGENRNGEETEAEGKSAWHGSVSGETKTPPLYAGVLSYSPGNKDH